MPDIDINGWRIDYGDEGEGPPIVLIHGLLMDSTMFDPQVAALSDRYRVITPDLRNHGASESRAEPFTQWDLMEDSIALCDRLGVETAVFGGVSQGGFQSLRAALRHPDRVSGLILIETQAGSEDPGKAPIYESMAEVVAADGWNDFILDSVAALLFGASTSDDLKKHWIERWRKLEPTHALATLKAVTRREDITDRLGEITAPAIVIHGEEDVAIEMERAQILADGLVNLIDFVKIPAAGHTSTVEQPAAVNEAIETFLAKAYAL
ncbi:MAG TPA: alpha/beta fold hydrolase [Actinomycetota bacterium]|nr:alpha/beta fold hydrolase [Actinomycetota bacterium]